MKTTSFINKLFIINSLFFLTVFLTPLTTLASKESPITISADEMFSTEATNSVTFRGDVEASQGEIKIRSDEMIIHYTKKASDEKNVSQKVEKITCTGNVEITREEWIGTSDKTIYLAKERKILLLGDAKAVKDQNVISGDKIVYYMDEGRSEVIGGTTTTITDAEGNKTKKKQRVNMTIIQQ